MEIIYKTPLDKTLPVVEVYPAVQSEGSRMGTPTIVVRTTGCTHRCFFGEGGWCDSWYTSIHPEKGKWTLEDIMSTYEDNPHIKEMMLTGGSPTMHRQLVDDLTIFCYKNDIFLTIETEGSHAFETTYPIDLLSISPKFSNSVPKIGAVTPMGRDVTDRMIKQHNKMRLKVEVIEEMISYHKDYHIKPVWDGKDRKVLLEMEEFFKALNVPKHKIYFMPAGDTRKALIESYPKVMNFCRDNGYRFSGRPHIIAFNTEREV